MRQALCLLVALVLTACAGSTYVQVPYDPTRCDRSGDEAQRRSC